MIHYIILPLRYKKADIEPPLLDIAKDNNLIFIDSQDSQLRDVIISLYQIRLYYNFSVNDNIFILLEEENKQLQHLVAYVFTILNIKLIYVDERNMFLNDIKTYIYDYNKTNRLYKRSYCNDCNSNYYSIFKHIFLVQEKEEADLKTDMEKDIINTLLSIDLQDIIVTDGSFEKLRLLNKNSLDRIVNDWAFNCNIYNKLQLIQLGVHILAKNTKSNLKYVTALVLLSEIHYHQDNYFHNFYHAIDVLQASHYLASSWEKLDPTDTDCSRKMTLLISALLHDSAHTGSNNALLSENKELREKMHTDESLLERIHFKVLYHIIKDLLSAAAPLDKSVAQNFQFHMSEKLILATDMQRHASFLQRLGEYDISSKQTFLQDDYLLRYKMIIKAADISNVTRPLEISAQWGLRISKEFKTYELLSIENKNKAVPCNDLNQNNGNTNNSCNVGELTVKDCISAEPGVCGSQIFFIKIFAMEFFSLLNEKFGDTNPAFKQMMVNLEDNYAFWHKIEETSNYQKTT